YVLQQYRDWVWYLQFDDRTDKPVWTANRDLRLFLRVWLAEPSSTLYLVMQLLGAAAAAGLCLGLSWAGWPRKRLLLVVLGAACAWMTLLGPATESSTYMLLAPSLAWALLEAYQERRPGPLRVLLLTSCSLLVLTQVANWFADLRLPVHALGTHAFAALL